MSLLAEIIRDAADGGDLTRLLRKCMVLAHNLNSTELANWTKAELNGYPREGDLPAYRVLECYSKGQFIGPMNAWQATLEIPLGVLPQGMRENYKRALLIEPIAMFINLVDKSNERTGMLMQPWPIEVARQNAPKAFAQGTQCLKAWNEISSAGVAGLLDQVNSRVLDFALAIAKDFPELAKTDDLLQESAYGKGATVQQTFNTTIMGSVGNLASGSKDVNQHSVVTVNQGDWASLQAALELQGVAATDIAELRVAINEDAQSGEVRVGTRVKTWLGNLMATALGGAGAIGVNAIGGAIAPLIAKYLGIAA
jgi:hypothetical protein